MSEKLIVSTTVDAPPAAVFRVLADPSTHADIDGTGWVREPLDAQPLTGTGQVFRMAMYHDDHPNKHYQMANQVIAIEPDRVIAWEPGWDNPDGSLGLGGWTWRYDLEPTGDRQTRVTLTYDWSGAPAAVRENMQFPPFPLEHLDNSLTNLAGLAVVTART
ncbi:polyketide cyclase [Mycolicibacterium sp. CH28]|uniref:SRPBCC family protein n=1 Tax=Mycolicibacterium sp. CH28 TaxID=2512237 RepID=UPI001081DF7A|nr:SRPBCC family protein [Mycolicibacterium sp. CH28]TGD89020.1 polyketide cyclase [Mycolicibacterium sp. CH28]